MLFVSVAVNMINIKCIYQNRNDMNNYYKSLKDLINFLTFKVTVSASFCIRPSFTDFSAAFDILLFLPKVLAASLRSEIDLKIKKLTRQYVLIKEPLRCVVHPNKNSISSVLIK